MKPGHEFAAIAAMVTAMALIASVALLAGCGPAPHPDAVPPAVETVETKVPVPVSCVRAGDVPARPAPVGARLTGNAVADSAILAAALVRAMAWGDAEAVLVAGCVRP